MGQKTGGIFVIAFVTMFVLICNKLDPKIWIKVKDDLGDLGVFVSVQVPRRSHVAWTGVPGLVRNGTVFFYKSRHNESIGKPLMLLDVYKKRFDWPPHEYVNLNESTDVSRGFAFVTASSANHFKIGLDMLSSTQHNYPGVKIIFWDLGLDSETDVKKIQSLCDVEYRKLNYSAYPDHVKFLKNYAFKPIVIAETIKDHPRLVWIDASIRFKDTGNFGHIKNQLLQTNGILQMIKVAHTIYAATHKQLLSSLDMRRTYA